MSLALALCAFIPAAVQDPPGGPPLALRVNRAIVRGVEHLRERQETDGRWVGDETRYPGGLTAFVAYTLVKSGARRGDPDLVRALETLDTIEPKSTYGISARLLLYAALRDGRWTSRAQACLDPLLAFQTEGLWAYPEGAIDLSNVQFALLGLWSAHELGLEVPASQLVACAKALWRFREKGSGFQYRPDIPVTTGMTAGTLCTIELLRRFGEDYPEVTRALRKKEKDRAVAEAWLALNWDPERNRWGPVSWTPGWHFAYLWAVQRFCELADLPRLGERDWYAEGAEYLVREQHADGGWGRKIEDTCFALLFLRRTTFSGGLELKELYEGIDAATLAEESAGPVLDASAAYLTDWLLAGPYLGRPGETGLHDLPFRPAKVRLGAKKKIGKKRWEPITFAEQMWTNLEEHTGRGGDHCVWVLGAHLTVAEAAEPVEAILWFALEDGWRIFLDGEEISSDTRVQAPIEPTVIVPVTLAPGEHDLIVVVEDAIGAAAFGARISGPDGKAPSAGISF